MAKDPTPALPKSNMETLDNYEEFICWIWGGCPLGRVG